MPFEAALANLSTPPVYQRIAEQSLHLRQLGMNSNRIAIILGVERKSVVRAIHWIQKRPVYSTEYTKTGKRDDPPPASPSSSRSAARRRSGRRDPGVGLTRHRIPSILQYECNIDGYPGAHVPTANA